MKIKHSIVTDTDDFIVGDQIKIIKHNGSIDYGEITYIAIGDDSFTIGNVVHRLKDVKTMERYEPHKLFDRNPLRKSSDDWTLALSVLDDIEYIMESKGYKYREYGAREDMEYILLAVEEYLYKKENK